MASREQLGAGWREGHEGPGFVHLSQPRSIAIFMPAPYSASVPLSPNKKGHLE